MSDLVKFGAEGGYKERDNHVPRTTDHYKTILTAGTAGFAEGRLEEASPVFEVARARDLEVAHRALDPEDTEVDASLVVLPQPQFVAPSDPVEDAKTRVRDTVDRLRSDPVVVGGPSPAQRLAAEGADEAPGDADARSEVDEERTPAGQTAAESRGGSAGMGPAGVTPQAREAASQQSDPTEQQQRQAAQAGSGGGQQQ